MNVNHARLQSEGLKIWGDNMARWANLRFQTKLFFVFLLLSSIPTGLIGAAAYQKSSDLLIERAEQDLSVIVDQLNTSIERQISDFDRFTMIPYYLPDIFSYLNQPYRSKEDWGTEEIYAQKTMARLMSAYPSINSSIKGLMIYGMNGTVNGYRLSGNTNINPRATVTDDQWYKEVIEQSGGFVITGVQEIDQFNGDAFQALIGSRLLMDEDYRPLAVIAIYISPDFIPRMVRSLELPTVQVSVFDRNNQLIYASDQELARNLPVMDSDKHKRSWTASASPDSSKSAVYSGVFVESGYLGWKTFMGVNREELLRGSRVIGSLTLLLVGLLVIVSAGVSWLLARGLAKPIYNLIRSMREVERGNFLVPVAYAGDNEIGRLETSFRKMVGRLDELVQSIEEKERQKLHAELYALRARIQPHFLYNTLNSIRMLAILQQSQQIAKLIQCLCKLLHANMKLDSELVPLEDEIQLLKDYVNLMDLRYTNVFNVEMNISDEVLNVPIPPMLLQPLVENAIYHGSKGLQRKLNIRITARLDPDDHTLTVAIEDDGAGFEGEKLEFTESFEDSGSSHIGLRNVQERIRLKFGTEYGLLMKREDGLTMVIVKLPYSS